MQSSIFQPNNHSKWKIEYRVVSPELFELLSGIFLKHYGEVGDEIVSVEQVNEAEINSNNFRINFLRDGKKERLLIRRYANNRNRAMLEDIAGVLLYLRKEGLRVPEIIHSRRGQVLEVEGEYSYIAFHFIDGDHFRGTLLEIADVALEIGKLDHALSLLPGKEALMKKIVFPEATLALREYSIPIWEDLFRHAEKGMQTSADQAYDRRFLDQRAFLLDAVKNTPLEYADDFTKQVVHFDLHPHNLLTDGGHLLATIDFDSLRVFERMRAVAFALHRAVRQHIVLTQPEDIRAVVTQATKTFLDAYCTHMPLTDEEVRTVPYFIRTEALARLSYAMKDNYLHKNPAWKGDLEKQVASLLESEYFAV